MKIATWNVNSIRTRQQLVLDWLQKHQVDILCLQETKVVDDDFPLTPFQELGYHIYISGQKAYNGVAIFSSTPLEEINIGFTPVLGADVVGDLDGQKRLITGVVKNIRIVNVYIPNGASVDSEKYEYKLQWLHLLREYLHHLIKTEKLDICLCGDFNIAPEDRDIYNPQNKQNHIMSSPKEREALAAIAELGFDDALRKFTQAEGFYTWWDYRASGFSRNRGWRIDHHYLTENLYQRLTDCVIDIEPRKEIKPSDHAPVIIDL